MDLATLESKLKAAQDDPYEFFQSNDIKQLKIASHPDRWLAETDRAKSVFEGLVSAHSASSCEMVGEWRLVRKLATGDLHDVFLAKGPSLSVLKRPRVSSKRMQKLDKCNVPHHDLYSKLLPKHIATEDNCNIFEIDEVHSTLTSFGKLDGRHVGWIGNRLWMVLGWVHKNKLVNGAVVPDHILLHKKSHGITLLGWIHSGNIGDKIQVVPKAWLGSYPAWAKKDKKLTPRLDIYMAAEILLNTLKEDAPRQIRTFLHGVQNISDISAWEIGDAWAEMLRRVYGQPKWVDLE